jgi:hypothetical protein
MMITTQQGTLIRIGIVVVAYAVLEGLEAVGLWFARRWAEYLTFVARMASGVVSLEGLGNTAVPGTRGSGGSSAWSVSMNSANDPSSCLRSRDDVV